MTQPLLVLLMLLCGVMLVWGLRHPDRIYEFPFLAGTVFAGWVLPQIWGLSHDEALPLGALDKTIVMTILCAFACHLGYISNRRPLRILAWQYRDRRLLWAAAILTLVGGSFAVALGQLPEELTSVSQWTGLPVAYFFFASVLKYGFAISLLLYSRRASKPALMLVFLASLFYLQQIVIAGRRGVLVEFLVILGLLWWFQRGVVIPRTAALVVLVGGSLLVNSIGDYRSVIIGSGNPLGAGTGDWKELATIDFIGNLHRLATRGGAELANAAYAIEAVDRTQRFDLGAVHWNALVFGYLPAQLVGTEFKQSLMIPLSDVAMEEFGYERPVGSTSTGMTDAFESFWYVGALKFFMIGAVMASLYRAAVQGHTTARLLYALMLTPALHAITHSTQWFISPWVHMGIFLAPVLLLARTPRMAATNSRAPVQRSGSMLASS